MLTTIKYDVFILEGRGAHNNEESRFLSPLGEIEFKPLFILCFPTSLEGGHVDLQFDVLRH